MKENVVVKLQWKKLKRFFETAKELVD